MDKAAAMGPSIVARPAIPKIPVALAVAIALVRRSMMVVHAIVEVVSPVGPAILVSARVELMLMPVPLVMPMTNAWREVPVTAAVPASQGRRLSAPPRPSVRSPWVVIPKPVANLAMPLQVPPVARLVVAMSVTVVAAA